MDLWRGSLYGGRDDAGLYLGYAAANANVDQFYSTAHAGTVTMNAYSVGGYWTHFSPQGWWLDAVGQGTWLGQVHGTSDYAHMSVGGSAWTASLEGGYTIHMSPAWSIEPQAQVIYQYAQLGTGSDAFGVTSFGDTSDVRGRIGAKASFGTPNGFALAWPATVWARVNLWHDFVGSAPSATFETLYGLYPTTLTGTLGQTWGEIDAGVDARLSKSLTLYGSAFYDHSIGSGASWGAGGRVGLKLDF
jgi:outer membrane autotransporter protein